MATDFRRKELLPELTKRIVETYSEPGSVNHLGHCPLPNYDEIIAATDPRKQAEAGGSRHGSTATGFPLLQTSVPARDYSRLDRNQCPEPRVSFGPRGKRPKVASRN